MGILDMIFPKKNDKVLEKSEELKMIDGYTPSFTTFEGGVFEMDLTRAIIASFARHCSKLKPECHGSGNERLARKLQTNPNPFQTTSQFLMQVATMYEVNNTVFLIPTVDEFDRTTGVFPLLAEGIEIKQFNNELYVVYPFMGEKSAIEFKRIGILTQHNYKDVFAGETNKAFETQLELMNAQNEGIIEGIKSSAKIRFMAKIANILKEKDLENERKNFIDKNLNPANSGGLILFDNKYENITQVKSDPWMTDKEQMDSIKNNAYSYFGTNEKILQNSFTSDEWNAYYEGKIEPFAIQLSIVLTNMFFTEKEKAHGNGIILAANRLQYLSNNEKLQTVVQLFDRGFLTHNEGLEIFNMAGRDEGDKYWIRKEYMEFSEVDHMKGRNDEDSTGETEGNETVPDNGDSAGDGE